MMIVNSKILFSSHYCVVTYFGCFGETGVNLNNRNDQGHTALDLAYQEDSFFSDAVSPRTIDMMIAAGDLLNTNHLRKTSG